MLRPTLIGFSVLVLAGLLVSLAVMLPGRYEQISFLENTRGIPYPRTETGAYLITEPLAHTDIYLHQSNFARSLDLTLTFSPGNLESLAVGVRENSFWLSYPQTTLWEHVDGLSAPDTVTRTVTIPLTDKLAAANQSVDLMFFAVPRPETSSPQWTLTNSSLTIRYAWPTYSAFKDAVKSVIYRERLL